MVKTKLFIIAFLICFNIFLQDNITAQSDDDFRFNEEAALEWSGNLDVKYLLLNMNRESAMYKLQFGNSVVSSFSQYRLEPYLNAEYRTGDIGFYLKTHGSYYNDEEAGFDLFEAYANYNLSFNAFVQAGKRVYNWGKGYAFNPVGFVNPLKDPENPELAKAGLLSANIEYIKSFSSDALQSLALQLIIIPPEELINSRYGEARNTDFAFRSYFLLWDTDIDLMMYYSRVNPQRFGIDFSRNITENFEIHGELSYNKSVTQYSIENSILKSAVINNYSCLFGVRYLGKTNTTVIAEYYYNGAGLTGRESDAYNLFLADGFASGSSETIKQTLAVNQLYFRNSTLMREYLYVKIIQPEPFDWLYFTPSVFTIYNLNDNSFQVSVSLSYKPVTNIEFLLWPSFLFGDNDSEFGSRQVKQKTEFWARVYF
ncbi:MAG: hypothetical protein JW995_05720 [Melioribacteraceae bacterium]|nr:hypothetical protein [Melioribacteraceae bacterium]